MNSEDIVRNFWAANMQAELALDSVEERFGIELGRWKRTTQAESKYFEEFSPELRSDAKSMADNYEVLYCLENDIRNLIKDRLIEECLDGEDWWNKFVPKKIRESAEAKMKEEHESGYIPRSKEPIDYTDFIELGKIITENSNWPVFGDNFSNPKAVMNVFDRLNNLRRPIAHCAKLDQIEIDNLHLTLKHWFKLME